MHSAPAWTRSLLAWYEEEKRPMPWRDDPSPYNTWISEIMLQQTQVATVIPYFNRFIQRFPNIQALAAADLDEIFKLWEGLGYYSRARNLQKTAKHLIEESPKSPKLPSDYKELQKLAGIGPYVAAAITSIAFHNPVPVVDGNVLRVFSRFWDIEEDIRLPKTRNQLFEKLSPIITHCNPSDFNQSIMELGALICSPKSPSCKICPISKQCQALSKNKVSKLPYKSKKAPVPHYTIGVAIIEKNGKILISKRKLNQMLGGLWEFPGGKQEKNESIEQCILREIKEETGLDIEINTALCIVKHAYSHFKITLHAYLCSHKKGKAIAKSAEKVKWVSKEDLDSYSFPTANKKILKTLIKETA